MPVRSGLAIEICSWRWDIIGEREYFNTLLLKDKDLNTSQLFYKSVPVDKHSNTKCIKQEYK